MRNQVWNYLKSAGRPLPADQILKDVLKIHSPNAIAADRVLRGILKGDPRFLHARGLWRLEARAKPPLVKKSAALFLKEFPSAAGQIVGGALHLAGRSLSRAFQLADRMAESERETLGEARSLVEDRLLVVWRVRELRLWNGLLRSYGLPQWDGDSILLSSLAARAFDEVGPAAPPESLAPLLGLAAPYEEEPLAMARFYADCWPALLELVPAEHRSSARTIQQWIRAGQVKPDFSRFAFGPDFLRQIPETPGVYIMRNRASDIIYVGKSNHLKRRVRSYFTPRALKQEKVARIHDQLYSLELVPTSTEVEALWTEIQIIRDFRPPFNLQIEVHERANRYGKNLNLILMVHESERAEAMVYFLRDGVFRGRLAARMSRKLTKRLCGRVRDIYFNKSDRRKRMEPDARESEIVARWFSARRKRLNYLDVDEAGSYDSVMRILRDYLNDPDKLSKKVYYR
jgi:hypothetical protein